MNRKIDGIYRQVKAVLTKPENRKKITRWTMLGIAIGLVLVCFLNSGSLQKVHAATYNCTTTTSGTWNWSTVANWSGDCAGTMYPGQTAGNTYNVAINSTSTTVINLDVSPAGSIGTLSIIGNGVAHTLYIYTTGNVGTTMNATGLITVSGPTASVTNTIAVGNGTLNAGGGLTITSGGSSGYNSTVSVGTGSAAGTLAVTGSITMSGAGTATLSTLYTGSNISMAGGTLGTAGTVSMVSGSTFTTTGTSTIGGAYTFGGNFAVSSGTTSFGGYAITVTGQTSVSGTLNASSASGAKTFTGLITVNNGGTFDQSAYAVATTINGGIANNSTNAFKTGTGTTTFSTNQNFTGSGAITIGAATTISNNIVITNNCTGAVTFVGVVTGGNSSSGITTGLNSDTIFNGSGTAFGTGTLTPYNGVNTIEYNYAGSQTIKANSTNNYYHMVLGGSGTKTWVSGVTALAGNLTMNGTTTATTMVAALAISGNLYLNQTSTGSLTTAGYAFSVTGTTTIVAGSATTPTLSLANSTGNKTLTGMVTLNGGTLSNGGATTTILGAGITNNGGTENLTGTTTISTAGATMSGANANSFATLTVTSPGTVNNTGAVTCTAALSGTGSFTNSTNATLNLNFTGTVGITTLTATAAGNTVSYGYNGTATILATTYYNLSIAGTSGAKTAGAGLTVNGNFTLGGAATFTTGSYTHNFYGNWVINTTAGTPITATGSTINFNTPGTPAATSITGTNTATLAFITVNVNNTSGFSISTSGAPTTVPISASGVVTVASGVTVTNNGTATFTSSLTGSGGWTNAGTGTLNDNFTGAMGITTLTANASGNTVAYGYAGAQTVFPSITYYNLTIQSSGAKTLTNVSTINGTFTVGGTCTATTAAAMTVGALTTSGGTLTTGNNLTVSGVLTITTGGVSNGAYTFSVGGASNISKNITFSSASGSATFTGDVTLNSGTVWSESAAQPINFGGSLTNNATTWTNSTGTHTFTGSGKSISGATTTVMPNTTIGAGASVTNSGTVTISTTLASGGSGSTWTNGNSTAGTLNFGGSSIGVATFTASATGNTVNYNASAIQTVRATSYYNLTLSGTSAKTMTGITAIGGSLTISGTATMTSNAAFTVTGALNYSSTSGTTTLTASTPISIGQYNQTGSGGTFADNANTITVTGTGVSTWTKSAGTFTASGTVTFTGAAPQIGATNFNNLTITVGTSASITGALDVNGDFNVTTGNFNCNGQNQTFAGAFTLASGTTFANGGTLTFDGASGTKNFTDSTSGSQDLGAVSINGSSGKVIATQTNMELTTLSIAANNTLNISSDTLYINGTGTPFSNSGTFTTTGSTVVYDGSGTATNIATVIYNNLTLTPTSATTYTLLSNLTGANGLNGSLTLSNSNATLNNDATNKYSIDLAGNWTNSGTFTNNSGGTVTFDGAGGSTQIVSGNTSFYNFTATATSARIINFASGSTTTVSGTWTITGALGQNISLGRDGGSGLNQWNINPAAWSVDYVTPSNSNNQAGSPISPTHYTDGGNNTNWFVSNNPPNTPASLTQGKTSGANDISESAWTNVNQPWFGFIVSDPDTSDTVKYRIQVDNTDSGFTHLVLDYTYGSLSANGTTFAYQVGQTGGTYAVGFASMTLSDSSTGYWWRVYGIDNSSVQSTSPAYFGTQATVDLKVDATAPTGGSVTNNANTGSLTQLGATWNSFDATVSGLLKYQYAVGTTAGGSDIKTWTDNGTSTSTTATGLNLQTSVNYYFSVKAYDNAGNTGSAVSASAQQVAPTLSFSIDSNTVTFSNLNAGNSWTDTKTTAVHTVTNAAGGYSVRAYANGLLTSIVNGSLTIPNYAAPYSSPTTWSGTGFGYTSNDPDIGGIDKWASSTKFCAFSSSAPGDIIADHEAAVNGSTGNADDIYTLTYKVVTPNAQAASTYQAIIYYISTANY